MAEESRGRKGPDWPSEEVRGHLRAAREEMRESVRAFFPPEFLEHRRAARREFLLAARAVIDEAIERTKHTS